MSLNKVKFVFILLNIILVVYNAYNTYIKTPEIVQNEFNQKWHIHRFIYDEISKAGGMTYEQICNKVMQERLKTSAEIIQSDVEYGLACLIEYRMIEIRDGQYEVAPSVSELIERNFEPYAEILNLQYDKQRVLDKVGEISYNNCYKYTVKDIYDKIKNEININYDYFEMLVYSNVRLPNVPPYVFDGYIINSDGRLCHLAAQRYK